MSKLRIEVALYEVDEPEPVSVGGRPDRSLMRASRPDTEPAEGKNCATFGKVVVATVAPESASVGVQAAPRSASAAAERSARAG